MKLLHIIALFSGFLPLVIQAEDVKSLSIQDAIKSNTFSAVVNSVKNSTPEDVQKSSQELNAFLLQLPDDESIAVSELIAGKINSAKQSESFDHAWDKAYAALISGSKESLSKISKDTPLKSLKDPSGKGLLTWSIISEADIEIVKYLLKDGCDVNEQDGAGNTPLLWTFLSGQSQADGVRKLLIESGADESIKNKVGISPLSFREKK